MLFLREIALPLKRALLRHGYNDNHSIYSLDEDDMNFLTYDEPGGSSDIPILPFDKVLISTFFDFVLHEDNVNDPVGTGWRYILLGKSLITSDLVQIVPSSLP
jgi:hypothetical protein